MNRRQAIPGNSGNAFGPGGATGVNPLVIAKSAIPFINLSSGTMGNNGALSGVTALPLTYSGGAYVWLPANSIAAGTPAAAAWYWCVFSSTTAGTVYNSTYTGGVPAIGTTTAFSTTGPGAFTGDTGEVFGISITVSAGSLGANGGLRLKTVSNCTNSAGNKTTRIRYSGTAGTVFSQLTIATTIYADHQAHIFNRGATNLQAGYGTWVSTGTAGLGPATVTLSSVDTTAATTAVVSTQKAAAADNIVTEFSIFELIYGA